MKDSTPKSKDSELNLLLSFLEITKKGEYAIVEASSLPYARTKEETEVIETAEEIYYYGVS